ncbi:hypothetical protein ACFW04_002472 [Cataglyphis niger]
MVGDGHNSIFTYDSLVHAISGAAGSVIAMAAFYPLDTVRSRLQCIINVLTTTPLWVVNTRLKMKGIEDISERNNNEYTTLYDGLMHIWKHEGLKQLWAGTLPSLMLIANPAIQFMTYESIKRRINVSLDGAQPPAWVFFAIGAIAKTIATSLTYPLQLVQTKLRVSITYNINDFLSFFFFLLTNGLGQKNYCTILIDEYCNFSMDTSILIYLQTQARCKYYSTF